ncbi:MAG: hypothetical protein B6D55_04110 [Candidatus Omnitrophica bacterium 4484_70.2]|nr:MAG: hypothetical protein B6D55_04110 [Candidatus Omnitrophica bacterium 4484_70.2]
MKRFCSPLSAVIVSRLQRFESFLLFPFKGIFPYISNFLLDFYCVTLYYLSRFCVLIKYKKRKNRFKKSGL